MVNSDIISLHLHFYDQNMLCYSQQHIKAISTIIVEEEESKKEENPATSQVLYQVLNINRP